MRLVFFKKGVVNTYRLIFLGSVLIISLVIISFFANKSDIIKFFHSSTVNSVIKPYLKLELTLPPSFHIKNQFPKKQQIIYVMGGDQISLKARFRKASQLFQSGFGDRIWVYILPGETTFDRSIGRSLLKQEWALKQFMQLSITEKDIDFIDFEEGFFGTLTEGQKIIGHARHLGYEHINIVTSTYHTKRVEVTFSGFSEKSNISFNIYDAEDITGFRYLLKEYIKLLVYRYILLPLYVSCPTCWGI